MLILGLLNCKMNQEIKWVFSPFFLIYGSPSAQKTFLSSLLLVMVVLFPGTVKIEPTMSNNVTQTKHTDNLLRGYKVSSHCPIAEHSIIMWVTWQTWNCYGFTEWSGGICFFNTLSRSPLVLFSGIFLWDVSIYYSLVQHTNLPTGFIQLVTNIPKIEVRDHGCSS